MPFPRQENTSRQKWQEVSRIVALEEHKDSITRTISADLEAELNELVKLTALITQKKTNDIVEDIKKRVIRDYISSCIDFDVKKTDLNILQIKNEVKKILDHEIKNKRRQLEERRKSYESQLKELFCDVLDFNLALKYITQDEYDVYQRKLDGENPFNQTLSLHDLSAILEYIKSTALTVKDTELSKLFRKNAEQIKKLEPKYQQNYFASNQNLFKVNMQKHDPSLLREYKRLDEKISDRLSGKSSPFSKRRN